ncbi:unnamed protein product [Gemmata massiliana]|uniref:Uncharacterized protein n=1 Tax=Gemmata massiliana TaxID=1210884 RepID=A0A6P2DH79_9BACT|nr:hypothetical protein [Gemmata massiliana]VTS01032.1 unnamed protein product [Gemmata massiliana]
MMPDDLPATSSIPAERRFWRRAVPLRLLVLLLGVAVMYLIYTVVR